MDKEICRVCVERRFKDSEAPKKKKRYDWGGWVYCHPQVLKNFDSNWACGVVDCHKAPGNTLMRNYGPPTDCPYLLEHTLMDQKPLYIKQKPTN